MRALLMIALASGCGGVQVIRVEANSAALGVVDGVEVIEGETAFSGPLPSDVTQFLVDFTKLTAPEQGDITVEDANGLRVPVTIEAFVLMGVFVVNFDADRPSAGNVLTIAEGLPVVDGPPLRQAVRIPFDLL